MYLLVLSFGDTDLVSTSTGSLLLIVLSSSLSYRAQGQLVLSPSPLRSLVEEWHRMVRKERGLKWNQGELVWQG